MLEKIETTVKSEQFQRAVLTGAGMIAALVASRLASSAVMKGSEKLTDLLMAKWHPTVETPAE